MIRELIQRCVAHALLVERKPLHQEIFSSQKKSADQKDSKADVQLHWYFFFHAPPYYPVWDFHAMRPMNVLGLFQNTVEPGELLNRTRVIWYGGPG